MEFFSEPFHCHGLVLAQEIGRPNPGADGIFGTNKYRRSRIGFWIFGWWIFISPISGISITTPLCMNNSYRLSHARERIVKTSVGFLSNASVPASMRDNTFLFSFWHWHRKLDARIQALTGYLEPIVKSKKAGSRCRCNQTDWQHKQNRYLYIWTFAHIASSIR